MWFNNYSILYKTIKGCIRISILPAKSYIPNLVYYISLLFFKQIGIERHSTIEQDAKNILGLSVYHPQKYYKT